MRQSGRERGTTVERERPQPAFDKDGRTPAEVEISLEPEKSNIEKRLGEAMRDLPDALEKAKRVSWATGMDFRHKPSPLSLDACRYMAGKFVKECEHQGLKARVYDNTTDNRELPVHELVGKPFSVLNSEEFRRVRSRETVADKGHDIYVLVDVPK